MARPKSKNRFQKPKAKTQLQNGQVKKDGKQYNIQDFSSYLDSIGLKIVRVKEDGNCFFRAIADQLEGNEEEHHKYRLMVVKFMKDNRLEFEPFVEDEVPFDKYCDSMGKDGEWAGQMELQACSLATRSNICIHRLMLPRYYMKNFDGHESRVVHLSYHNEVHYNSVRLKEDPCSGPAKPVVIEADADLSATSNKGKAAATIPKETSSKNVDTRSIQMVMTGCGCDSYDRAEEVLQQVYGDVDVAIEFFLAEQLLGCDLVERVDLPSKSDAPDSNCGAPVVSRENTSETEQTENKNDEKLTHDDNISKHCDKKLPRNKICPCGSKKKYKDCCGNHEAGSRMSKKERKQAKRGGRVKVALSSGSDGGLQPDVGALCI